jgi:hypothetical protein
MLKVQTMNAVRKAAVRRFRTPSMQNRQDALKRRLSQRIMRVPRLIVDGHARD